MYVKNLSPANQLSSLKKVNFSGAFQWFCIGSSPWPHLWSFSRMTITDYFIKERSDQNLPYHNLSAILSSGRQFEASYIKYVLRNGRAQSLHDAGLPRQWQVITCPDSTPWARISGGNLGPKLNGSVRSNRKVSKKTGPPFEVDHFSRSDRLEFCLNGSRPQFVRHFVLR